MYNHEIHRSEILNFQRNEITEYHIYKRLAEKTKSQENRRILEKIAYDELRHYQGWESLTQTEVAPNKLKITLYYWISRLFGITFGIQLMERGEQSAQEVYSKYVNEIANIEMYVEEENDHENALIDLIDEEHLRYVGSIVLGLNDALVELTGALAGLTLAFQNSNLIALSGAITGFAAAFSMAASEYLSTRTEETNKDPIKASVYTGVTYLITVIILILPYLIFDNYLLNIILVLIAAVLIIAFFNFYIATVRGESFRKRFFEMAAVSLGIAGLSFLMGYFLRILLGVEI